MYILFYVLWYYGIQIEPFVKVQQCIVKNHHAAMWSQNMPLHYHSFEQHNVC